MHQSQSPLASFGSSQERMRRALDAVRAGQGVCIVDDEDRENEGDLIFPAQTLSVPQMALLIRHCSGIVCLCLTDERVRRLGLPMMTEVNTNTQGTAFTVSIEAAVGVTTGVSAADRVTTVLAAVRPGARPEDLRRPGHVFPLRARPGGVLERRGHTEATVDLMALAGLAPCGVLCELTNEDGSMARLPEVAAFARAHNMPLLSVEDIAAWRRAAGEEKTRQSGQVA
ncbi:MAG: 3,4-dihydroxy-2-butanone-4-phosphate synthase [Desulfovibrio sp.]|uniref:3,4-dihydroxy-2-butanone-4-phosphate synthase n=1 Tax=Desulfovibrio sp. TaxID=885 RepID=UPI002586E19F|nr:3,4-dihydroxy-2-butanone-4-phosphate synthase [Desulfovibrio sp.]MCD7984637.1 3,4-dihydroxy-2-butanone-4-phosphate synthase [Desulfovibrio sp.]